MADHRESELLCRQNCGNALRTEPSKRSEQQRNLVKYFGAKLESEIRQIAPDEVRAALGPLDDRIRAIRAAQPKEPPRAYIWYEDGPKAPPTHILKRGDPTIPASPSNRACLPSWPRDSPPRPRPPPGQPAVGSGWLDWLTSPENPLVARVIVNRIWQFHFGEGLVASSNDFGVMGDDADAPRTARLAGLASSWPAAGGSSRCTG